MATRNHYNLSRMSPGFERFMLALVNSPPRAGAASPTASSWIRNLDLDPASSVGSRGSGGARIQNTAATPVPRARARKQPAHRIKRFTAPRVTPTKAHPVPTPNKAVARRAQQAARAARSKQEKTKNQARAHPTGAHEEALLVYRRHLATPGRALTPRELQLLQHHGLA